jgi:hypothetical protein
MHRYPHPARGGPFQLGSQSLQWGDGLLRNGSSISEAAHPGCSVATDCAGGDNDCAAPCDCHPATLQRGRCIQQFHDTPLGPWKKVREGLDHRQHKKANTFGRFQILRNAHIKGTDVLVRDTGCTSRRRVFAPIASAP